MSVAVVTGAGSGIGRATAQRFARKGSIVIVSDINETTGNETVGLIRAKGGNAIFRRLDVGDVQDWEAFAAWVCAEFGVPDVVVNNAGILIGGGFLEQTGDDWRRMTQINLMSPIIGSRLFVERMVGAGVRGHIVNVASVGAFLPAAVAPSYVTAKAGVWFGTQALRSNSGRRVLASAPYAPGLSEPVWVPTEPGAERTIWRARHGPRNSLLRTGCGCGLRRGSRPRLTGPCDST